MTQSEQLQSVWQQYECEHNHVPASGRTVTEWGIVQGLIVPPTIDPVAVLASQMSRALREEYGTDPQGRRYRRNHAVRITNEGVQYAMWGMMDFASLPHMEMAFTQRREQIVGDCVQLKTDVDVYNDKNPAQPRIQLELDFTEDVAERELSTDDYGSYED